MITRETEHPGVSGIHYSDKVYTHFPSESIDHSTFSSVIVDHSRSRSHYRLIMMIIPRARFGHSGNVERPLVVPDYLHLPIGSVSAGDCCRIFQTSRCVWCLAKQDSEFPGIAPNGDNTSTSLLLAWLDSSRCR